MVKRVCSVGCLVTDHVSLFIAVARKLRAKTAACILQGFRTNGVYFFVALDLYLFPTPFYPVADMYFYVTLNWFRVRWDKMINK